MAKTSKTKIREAILANRGGHEKTSDAGIMTIWNSLGAETQKQYLDSVAERKTEGGGKKSEGKKDSTTKDTKN